MPGKRERERGRGRSPSHNARMATRPRHQTSGDIIYRLCSRGSRRAAVAVTKGSLSPSSSPPGPFPSPAPLSHFLPIPRATSLNSRNRVLTSPPPSAHRQYHHCYHHYHLLPPPWAPIVSTAIAIRGCQKSRGSAEVRAVIRTPAHDSNSPRCRRPRGGFASHLVLSRLVSSRS